MEQLCSGNNDEPPPFLDKYRDVDSDSEVGSIGEGIVGIGLRWWKRAANLRLVWKSI